MSLECFHLNVGVASVSLLNRKWKKGNGWLYVPANGTARTYTGLVLLRERDANNLNTVRQTNVPHHMLDVFSPSSNRESRHVGFAVLDRGGLYLISSCLCNSKQNLPKLSLASKMELTCIYHVRWREYVFVIFGTKRTS